MNASASGADRRSFIGRQRRFDSFAEAYRSVSSEDESAAETLQQAGHHRQAVYFLMQAMEKLTRFAIFSEVSADVLDKDGVTYRERTLTHNLDELFTVLLEVYQETINDSRVSEQIERQFSENVLQGVWFGVLHNDVRYPRYLDRTRTALLLEFSEKDSTKVGEMLARLKRFIEGFQQLKPRGPREQPAEPIKRQAATPTATQEPAKSSPSPKPLSEFKF